MLMRRDQLPRRGGSNFVNAAHLNDQDGFAEVVKVISTSHPLCKSLPKKPKNRFGYVCAQAKVQPVFVEKDGCIDSVILSVQAFEALSAASQPKTLAECQKAFNQTYKAWLVEQNAGLEKNGLWCDDLRVW
jgi:hypothetical protein